MDVGILEDAKCLSVSISIRLMFSNVICTFECTYNTGVKYYRYYRPKDMVTYSTFLCLFNMGLSFCAVLMAQPSVIYF